MPEAQLPLATWLHALALEQIENACTQVPVDAHAARVECKRVRAWLRLLRPQLAERYAPANALLRDAAQSLAGRRKSQALQEICALVQQHSPEQDWAGFATRLLPSGSDTTNLDSALQRLQRARTLLADQPLPAMTPEQLARAMQHSYRRCRKAMHKAGERQDADALHDWRQRSKYHGYQCEMLAPLWPALRLRRARLRKLWDALGAHQDLHDLQLEITQHRRHHEAAISVESRLQWIEAHQQRTAKRAMKAGTRLFGCKPAAWWMQEIARAD